MSANRDAVAVGRQGMLDDVIWHVARTAATVERSRGLIARRHHLEARDEPASDPARVDGLSPHRAGAGLSIGELALLGEAMALLGTLQNDGVGNGLVAQAAGLAYASLHILLDCVLQLNDGALPGPAQADPLRDV